VLCWIWISKEAYFGSSFPTETKYYTSFVLFWFLFKFYRELIHELHKRGTEVYLISGGFRSLIEPLALDLNIPLANIFANKIKFYYDGML